MNKNNEKAAAVSKIVIGGILIVAVVKTEQTVTAKTAMLLQF